jgi:thiamine-phosphate diphosphorylase
MRPLPRVLAVTDAAVIGAADFPIRVAAVAASGPAVGIVVRWPGASAADRLRSTDRVRSLARPPAAATIGHRDPALGRIANVQGVQLQLADLGVADARKVLGAGWVGVSVHDLAEAERARAEGADYVVAGNVFETASHPERPAKGLDWLAQLAAVGIPVFAIGGVTGERISGIKAAGAWGVAAITALWGAPDSAVAVEQFLRQWSNG